MPYETTQSNLMEKSAGGLRLLKMLPAEHMLYTLTDEHATVLQHLRRLDDLRFQFTKQTKIDEAVDIYREMGFLADGIVDLDSHQLREEQVLFYEMERQGITRQTQLMHHEHELINSIKTRFQYLTTMGLDKRPLMILQTEIDETLDRLISNLVVHIQKEDHEVFPMAIKAITQPEVWAKMKMRCDEIGYCSFTKLPT